MGWRSVIVTQHAKMSYSAGLMVVQTMDGTSEIPIDDMVLLMVSTTQAVITSALISALVKNNIKVIFVDHAHQPIGEVNGYQSANRDCKVLENQFNWQQQRKDILWTKIVAAKINNQISVLKCFHKDVECLQNELDQLEVGDETNREAVVARKYFPLLYNDDFLRHNGSAINAALDYGYSILLSETNRIIAGNGYLTELGIHHRNQANHFNLGSDLMEPFRPIIDYWVAGQKFRELTPEVKIGLIDCMNIEILFNGKKEILRNAISRYVTDCLNYLSGDKDETRIEVEFTSEVPNDALNGNV